MSNSFAAIRFDNGEIFSGIYYGSGDEVLPGFVAGTRVPWRVKWVSRVTAPQLKWVSRVTAPQPNQGEMVDIYTDYGGGTQWAGYAQRIDEYRAIFTGPQYDEVLGIKVRGRQPWVADIVESEHERLLQELADLPDQTLAVLIEEHAERIQEYVASRR